MGGGFYFLDKRQNTHNIDNTTVHMKTHTQLYTDTFTDTFISPIVASGKAKTKLQHKTT